MPQLKAVEFGFNKYCGPSVLSILTGRSTDECARVIQSINGQYDIRGVLLTDLLRAADKLGFDQINVNVNDMSLFRALITLAPKGNAQYIVTVPNHFVCVEVADNKIYFCDNHTKDPIPAASSARLQMLVISVHRIVKRKDFVEPVKPVKKEEAEFEAIMYYRCKSCNYSSPNKAHYNWCKFNESNVKSN